MAKEIEKVLAILLRPEIKSVGGEIPERLESVSDAMTLADVATVTPAPPEGRVGYARVGFSEVA